ncbi:MAG: glycoside hydrolase, partial [Oscillospiraceae bacterium]|nr:glycoside hydrolase [Oscillospiraceae bacterium]
MAYKILDISKYQPNVDYVKVAAAVDGVILRIGLTYWGAQNMGKDSCFEKHYAGFKAQGCPVGVYYYSAADSVAMAEKEAAYCLELMKGKQFELPIFYDVENSQRQSGLSKELL